MKVLRIIKSVNPGGGGPIEGLLQQATRLAEEGVVTEVVCLDDPAADHVVSFPFKVHALGVPHGTAGFNPLRRYGYSAAFVPWLKAHLPEYDVAVVHGLWNYANFGARRALVGGPTPYVVFSHGMLDPWFKKHDPLKAAAKQAFWLFNEGPLVNNASFLLFTTDEEMRLAKNAFLPYHPQERVVAYGTSDIMGEPEMQKAAFRTALPALGNRRYILFISRIHPKKGCDLLLDAFAAIAGEYPEYDLVMAGPDRVGWVADLKAQAERLGISSRVHWPGMLRGDVKAGALRGAEAFILPSHQENFGIAVAEAMAAARPVLITDKINIWREVEASGGGLVDTDDAGGVERLLRKFLALSTQERDAMGQSARQAFLSLYELGRVCQDLLEIFKSVSQPRSAA